MSLSCHDCYSDLLCGENAGILDGDDEPEYSPEMEFLEDVEESIIAAFVEGEGEHAPGVDYPSRFRSRSLDAAAREEAVAWILKVHAYYSFQPLTAYLAVNYMDRFLSTHRLPRPNGWPLQLLCVASLSLAAKMEETLIPSFLDLQIEGARFIFEPRTIRRMELLVLSALDWRLRSITPFSFIHFFACKVDSTRAFTRFLVSRATQFILATIREIDFLDFGPSAVAAAAVLCAAGATPDLSLIDPENAVSWCVGLSKVRKRMSLLLHDCGCGVCINTTCKELCQLENVYGWVLQERILSCYGLMQTIVIDDHRRRKPPKVLPQLRVTTPAILGENGFCSSSSSSSSNKRRKLNNHRRWVDEDGGEDDDGDDDDVGR